MKLISENVTQAFGQAVLKAKHESPHIFFAAGVVGVIGAGVLACKATLKVEKVLDETKTDIEVVKAGSSTVDEADLKKELAVTYVRGAVRLGKLYGPAIGVGVVSIACLTGSHVQMTRRNTALTVTLAAMHKAFEDYRARVQKELGVDAEKDIYGNVSEVELLDDNGKKVLRKVGNPTGISPYARWFDAACPEWTKDPEQNKLFLLCQQEYANNRLRAKGWLSLNEVYRSIGIPEEPGFGQIMGWVIGDGEENYIDFGMYDPENRRFINGEERSILLDFNVHGVLHDLISN